MTEDIINLWGATGNEYKDDINIIKTWLVNGSDGQTYPINDRFLDRIVFDESKYGVFDFSRIECEWDECIGWKHDYKIDDPDLEVEATKIRNNLMNFINKVNKNSDKYFGKEEPKKVEPKEYWTTTYIDMSNDDDENINFGNVGGLIYETKDEAWNAMVNDSREFNFGLGVGQYALVNDEEHFRISCYDKDNNLIARWEIQRMQMSREVNELD